QMASIRSVIPHIVPDQQVKPEDVPPPNDAMDHVQISTVTRAGDSSDFVAPPFSGAGAANGVIELPASKEDNTIREIVGIEASYPAGMEAWRRFLSKNFRVPDEVSGTVVVQFIVDKEGNVSDVHAISGPDELRTEGERVIKKSGRWSPGIQNGLKVNSYKRQPIVVQFQHE
ncbi:MAG TPA: energy transducer TonB, partial [Puia sp.]